MINDSNNSIIKVTIDTTDADKKLKELQKSFNDALTVKGTKSTIPDGVAEKAEQLARAIDGVTKSTFKLPPALGAVGSSAKDVGNNVKSLGDQFRDGEISIGQYTKSLITLNPAISSAIVAFGAIAIAGKKSTDILRNIAPIESAGEAFKTLSDRIGSDAVTGLEQLREATKGFVSDADLISSSNQAILLGVNKNSESFAQLASDAVKLGDAMGINAKQALDSLTLGIGRQSKLILDNLGIIVNAETAYQNYALAIGTTASKLTDSQKKLAFQAEAFEQIRIKSASLPAPLESASDAVQRLDAITTNLSNTFGLQLSKVISLRDAYNSISQALKNVDAGTFASTFGQLGAIFQNIIATGANLLGLFSQLYRVFAPFIDLALIGLNSILKLFNDLVQGGVSSLKQSLDNLGVSTENFIKKFLIGLDVISGFFANLKDIFSITAEAMYLSFSYAIDQMVSYFIGFSNISSRIWTKFKDVASASFDLIVALARDTVNSIIGAFDVLAPIGLDLGDIKLNGQTASQALAEFKLEAKRSIGSINDETIRPSVDRTFLDLAIGKADELIKKLQTTGTLQGNIGKSGILDTDYFKNIGKNNNQVLKPDVDTSGLQKGKDEADKLKTALDRVRESIVKVQNVGKLDPVANEIKKLAFEAQQGTITTAEFGRRLEELKNKAISGVSGVKEQVKALDEFNNKLNTASTQGFQAYDRIKDAITDVIGPSQEVLDAQDKIILAFREYDKGALNVESLRNAIGKIAIDANLSEDAVNDLVKAVQSLDRTKLNTSSGFKIDSGKGFFGNLFSGNFTEAGADFQRNQNTLSAFGDSAVGYYQTIKDVYDSIQAIREANKVSFEKNGDFFGVAEAIKNADNPELQARKTTNKVAGAVAGAFFGQAFGNLVGEFLNSSIGQAIQDFEEKYTLGGARLLSAIFGEDPGTTSRKGFRKLINTLLKESKLEGDIVFADGSVKFQNPENAFREIKDQATGVVTNQITEDLKNLKIPPELLATFDALGVAIGGLTDGFDSQLLGQFGQLLAFNFRDAQGLNDLQILLQQAGVTAEQLGAELEKAFLAGDIGATQFLQSTSAVNDLLANGIPGAVGAVELAFQNLSLNGLKSGAQGLDAIKDLAFEAGEISINSFEGLRQKLLQSGASIEDVNALFTAFSQNGITTLEQLGNISTLQGAGILSALEGLGFTFASTSEQVSEATANVEQFIQSANTKVVTEWEINVTRTGDDVPTEITQQTGTPTGEALR